MQCSSINLIKFKIVNSILSIRIAKGSVGILWELVQQLGVLRIDNAKCNIFVFSPIPNDTHVENQKSFDSIVCCMGIKSQLECQSKTIWPT
jgi:hypothetical protein